VELKRGTSAYTIHTNLKGCTMILKYSDPKGVPYIELEGNSRLSFPLLMENKLKGWQWITFSGRSTESVCISGKGAKNKRYLDTTENISFITDMSLSEVDKRVKGKNGPLSPATLGFLKKEFSKLAPDGWMSRDSLSKLEVVINGLTESDVDRMNDDPTIIDEDEDDG
jgi:hypothetical protein